MTATPFQGTDIEYPQDTIIPYYGAITDVPSGWAYCDGNNGTPDLRNRYIKGVPDSSTDPGATGGSNSLTLTESQMASHDHTTGTTDTQGDHTHSMSDFDHGDYSETTTNGNNTVADSSGSATNVYSNGDHGHGWNIGSTGNSESIENRPASREMAFIKKI